MLRQLGVRTKLLAVLAIPTVLLVLATTLLVGAQVSAARGAGHVRALTEVAVNVNRVVHALQGERSATLVVLAAANAGDNEAATKRLAGRRAAVDRQLALLRETLADSPIEEMSDAVVSAAAQSEAAHAEIVGARRSIDSQVFFGTEADTFYSRVIQTDLRLPGVVAGSGTDELGSRLRAYEALSAAIEAAAHERDVLEVGYLRGSLFADDYKKLAGMENEQTQSLQAFRQVAPRAAALTLDNALVGAENFAVDEARNDAADLLAGGKPDAAAAAAWVEAANTRIAPMVASETPLVSDIAETAAATQSEQERRALLFAGAALFGLIATVALAVNLARRITRPLRRLTAAAVQVGAELPHMVERMQTPGEGPGIRLEPIPVESGDEIGRLAAAFNTVNEVTVQVAEDQAALRASIAEMFVNVARRNQVLLGRQLVQIDRMESREEDPDVLESLFTLDHLATRMRRNAESLLVLAGLDSTRRLRDALPLSDVIRTAVSEIEAFDRVDLAMNADPDVSGRIALPTAHLLAELLENATHFSNPDTRVVVSASLAAHGVDLTITDYGLGMSADEIAAANADIANPPLGDIAVSQRLGLFVVGRLAARLGATVTLRRGRVSGTVATVALPADVFEQIEQIEQETEKEQDGTPATAHTERPAVPAEPVQLELPTLPAVGPPVEPHQQAPARHGRLPRRGQGDAADAPPTPAEEVPAEPVVAEPVVTEPVVTRSAEPARDEPAPLPEPVAQAAPLPEPVTQPAPLPEPQAPLAFAPSFDILPGRPMLARPPVPEALPVLPLPSVLPEQPAQPATDEQPEPDGQPADRASSVAIADQHHTAVSELRGLYEPSYAPPAAPTAPAEVAAEGLARRRPKPAVAVPESAAAQPARPTRSRTASDVRGMLSGFRAGVERGRTGASGAESDSQESETESDTEVPAAPINEPARTRPEEREL